MIPDENKRASYRCAQCGWFTLLELHRPGAGAAEGWADYGDRARGTG